MRTNVSNLISMEPRHEAHRLGAAGTGRTRRFVRRGNAMIMAVSLTVLLAIIGSSFVLMARMDRQSVRGMENASALETATDYVLARIMRVLADDLVDNVTPYAEPYDPTQGTPGFTVTQQTQTNEGWDYIDLNMNGVWDAGEPCEQFTETPSTPTFNGRYDNPFNSLLAKDLTNADPFASRESYDAPWIDNPAFIPARGADPWLASSVPTLDSSNRPVWKQISQLLSPLAAWNVAHDLPVRPINPSAKASGDPAQPSNLADADGDGMADARWTQILGLTPPDKELLVAARITDNSACLNVNTIWQRPMALGVDGNRARLADADSYGEFPHQIDLSRFLKRGNQKFNNQVSSEATNINSSYCRNIVANPPAQHDFDSILFSENVIRDYGLFGKWASTFRPFGITDELELRNRYCIDTKADTPLEATSAMNKSLGVYDELKAPTGNANAYRILPFQSGDGNLSDDELVALWYKQLVPTGSLPLTTADGQRPDQRHLLTTYSFARDIRPTSGHAADIELDRALNKCKWRKVNINSVLEILSTPPSGGGLAAPLTAASPVRVWPSPEFLADPKYIQAVKRLSLALQAMGYTADDSIRFLANLIDYIDADISPTVILQNAIEAGLPSVDIYGTEIQPFITEVYTEVNATGKVTKAAVELFNPYSEDIPAGTFTLVQGSNQQPIGVIPKGQRFVCNYQSVVGIAEGTTEGQGFELSDTTDLQLLRVNPQSPTLPAIRVDVVKASDMEKIITKAGSGTHSIWRPEDSTVTPGVQHYAPWGWARNAYTAPQGSHLLGQPRKVDPAHPMASDSKKGVAIHVGDRRPLIDANETPPKEYWRVNGWYELSQVLLTGNPDTSGPQAGLQTITEKISKISPDGQGPGTLAPNGNGAGSSVADVNANPAAEVLIHPCLGTFHENGTQDLTGNGRGDDDLCWESRISFFSGADDGTDNLDLDGDGNPATHPDRLMECRIPGRVNVNTASEDVLKALVPRLADWGVGGTPTTLTDAQLELLSTWYAQAIVYLRDNNGPFVSLGDLAERLSTSSNPGAIGGGLLKARPGVFWFGNMLDVITSRSGAGFNQGFAATRVGDAWLNDDMEERNWLINRMANLLTVRSDTFTAYFVVRIQSTTSADFTERRYVAILDRSNVFLPEIAAKNGSFRDVATGLPLPPPYTDDCGEMAIFDNGGTIYGPASGTNPYAQEDPDHFDSQYVYPKVVAIRQVPDPR